MALSYIAWVDGITAIGIVFFGTLTGLFFFYKSRKFKLPLLSYAGLTIFFVGLAWLGQICDFLTVFLTGKNLELAPILGYMWLAPAMLCSSYIFAELIIPKRKVIIMTIYIILSIIFELYLFLDIKNSLIINPYKPNEDLIDTSVAFGSPAFILIAIFFFSLLTFGLVYLYRGFQRTGILRKKYFFLAFGYIISVSFASLEGFFSRSLFLPLIRGVGVTSALFMYYGLREEPEKIKKAPAKKEIEIKESLFRIAKRPSEITEEEVSISKEKRICLVCKGVVSGISYICTECGTFYCINCSQAIIDLENSCWACSAPIDKSKPVKPFKKEGEIDIKISKKPKKK